MKPQYIDINKKNLCCNFTLHLIIPCFTLDNVKYYGEPRPDYEFNVWTHPDCHGTEFENGNRFVCVGMINKEET